MQTLEVWLGRSFNTSDEEKRARGGIPLTAILMDSYFRSVAVIYHNSENTTIAE